MSQADVDVDLPKGWVVARIGDIAAKGEQRTPVDDDEFFYVDIGSIDRSLKSISAPQKLLGKEAPSRARKVINTGDILVSLTRPNLNAVALVGQKLDNQIASTGFEVIKPIKVDSRYIFALVRSKPFIDSISGKVQGALYPAAKSDDVRGYEFFLPPLAEQQQIAAKLDELLAQVDTLKTRLDTIPKILKRFRQSVLAAAVNGRLTEDWREKKGGSETESWQTISVEGLGKVVTGNTPSKKGEGYYGGKFPMFKPTDLDAGYHVIEGSDHLTESGIKASRFIPAKSTLVTCIGATIGKTGFSRIDGTCNQQINVVIPNEQYCNEWVFFLMCSPQMQQAIITNASSTTLPILNKSRFSELPLEAPSKEEQTEIVRRVEQLFTFADQIEQRVKDAQTRVNHLTQAILAKAFRGELTVDWRAQNSDLITGNNCAAALLVKIQAERECALSKKARKTSSARNNLI